MKTAKIALVTGATGFVGSWLVKRLMREGFEVRALTSGTSRDRLAGIGADDIRWFEISAAVIAQATLGATHFFNFAVVYDRPEFSDAHIREVNVELPLRIIAALNPAADQVTCVLGDTFYRKFPVDATRQRRYTASKLELAHRVQDLPPSHTCRIGMLLIEQVYGPAENLEKAYPRVIRQLLQNVARVRLTPCDQRRDFLHIADVIEAVMATSSGEWHGVAAVECGSGRSTPVRTVFERLKAFSGSHSELGFGDIPYDQDIPDSVADISWLGARGWASSVPLEKGLEELVLDVKQRSTS